MRFQHKAGEKLFIDWAGDTVPIVDADSGEVRPAYLFVAVLGASNYTYVEAAASQDSEAFLAAHVRALEFYGGCARILVPDYVPRHIVAVMCPLALCGRTAAVVGVCAPLPALAATRSSEGSEPFEEGWVVARYYSSEAVDDLKANAAMPQHDNLDSATAGRRHHLPEALRLCAHLSPAGPQPRHVLGAAAT